MSEIPRLPIAWRPRLGRAVSYGFAAVVVVGAVIFVTVLPAPFRLADRLAIVAFALLVAAVLHLLGRCRVYADGRGVTVVNAVRTHRLEWAEVVDVTMLDGDPWPRLDLADGSTLGVMGIQSADGERARRAVAELLALVHERGEASEPR